MSIRIVKILSIFVLVPMVLQSCGKSGKHTDPATNFATMTVAKASEDSDNGQATLTAQDACSRQDESNFFQGQLRGSNGQLLVLRIQALKAENDTYDCIQADSNKTDINDVGTKYEGCSVTYSTLDGD